MRRMANNCETEAYTREAYH